MIFSDKMLSFRYIYCVSSVKEKYRLKRKLLKVAEVDQGYFVLLFLIERC